MPTVGPGACHSNPCLHGGTCVDRAFGSYDCICTLQYTGPHCEGKKMSLRLAIIFLIIIIIIIIIIVIIIIIIFDRPHRYQIKVSSAIKSNFKQKISLISTKGSGIDDLPGAGWMFYRWGTRGERDHKNRFKYETSCHATRSIIIVIIVFPQQLSRCLTILFFPSVDKCADCDANADCFYGKCRCRKGYIGTGYVCMEGDVIFKRPLPLNHNERDIVFRVGLNFLSIPPCMRFQRRHSSCLYHCERI